MTGKQSAIFQELESDDELPENYIDATILPAYLDDGRFDVIKFSWINNDNQSAADTQSEKSTEPREESHKSIGHFYLKGVLKRHDLYCLKAVQPFTCNSTVMWFVHFLLQKDLQSDYKYLRSCLVHDPITTTQFKTNFKDGNENLESVRGSTLEIVIKS